MLAPRIAGAVLSLITAAGLAAQTGDSGHTLLSTAALAREIRDLQGPEALTPRIARSLVASIRDRVSSFIIRQIQAYPSISPCDLQKQLAAAFATQNQCNGAPDTEMPRVFAQPWGNEARVFAVTYQWFGFYGKGGSQTILESYVWNPDHSVRRVAGIVAGAFDGFLTEAQQVCWFPGPDRYWVLVSGVVGGASGRVLGGSAAVFEIGPEQIRTIWSARPGIGNLRAFVPPASLRWEIEYADSKRFYAGLAHARLLDIYQLDYTNQSFRLLIHQPLD